MVFGTYRLDYQNVVDLVSSLIQNHVVIAPKISHSSIMLGKISSYEELPKGCEEEMAPGTYRLIKTGMPFFFRHTITQNSWKDFLFPSKEKLYTLKKEGEKLSLFQENPASTKPVVFLGVKSCDLAAIAKLDTIFLHGPRSDPFYRARRQNILIIATNCTRSASTCFCNEMETGPKAVSGFDIALTEYIEDGVYKVLAEAGTERGNATLQSIHPHPASEAFKKACLTAVYDNAKQQQRKIAAKNVPAMLKDSWHLPRWQKVSRRCVSCANCTLVCPTCFCSDTKEELSLDSSKTEYFRSWQSCFHTEHSHLHNINIRSSTLSKYRQWLTHKFGTWWDQFQSSGCVGCGRCITWCPVGIDVTEEINVLDKEYHENHC